MIYQWKDGSHAKVDAQEAGEELERIRTFRNGRLTSEDVVEASRNPDAPLHPAFEWNDAIAAEAHRKEQAGYLIRSIEIVATAEGGHTTPLRAFVSVKRDEDRSYTSVQHALSDDELRGQVVSAAFAELEAWRKRHAELIEFARIFAEIDQARIA